MTFRSGSDDSGSIAPLVPIVMFALLLLGGLVVDGSRDLNARGNAQAFAEEAARAGATAVDLTQADLTLDQTEAAARLTAFCAAILGTHAAVTITDCGLADQQFDYAETCNNQRAEIVVNTKVTLQIDTTLLGMIGLGTLTVTGQAHARPYQGTTADNAC